jgi:hypothetical protein
MLRRIALVAAGTFALIGLFFWLTLTLRVIQPIERLAPISESIGLTQGISKEARNRLIKEARRGDQIGRLIHSILKMEDSIAARMKEQATLLETSTAVISSLDPEVVLDQILEQMGRLLSVQMYAIIALDEQAGAFRIRASRGLSRQFTESLSIWPTEPDSVTMRALHSGQAIQVSDSETDPSYTVRRFAPRRRVSRHPGSTTAYQIRPSYRIGSFSSHATRLYRKRNSTSGELCQPCRDGDRERHPVRAQRHAIAGADTPPRISRPVTSRWLDPEQPGGKPFTPTVAGAMANLSAQELAGMPVHQILARILANSTDSEKAQSGAQGFTRRVGNERQKFRFWMTGAPFICDWRRLT